MKRVLMVLAAGIEPVDKNDRAVLARLSMGLALWKEGRFDVILVTGGIFLPRTIQTRPAAELMADWLFAQGVPSDRVMIENKALNTWDNISGGLRLLSNRFGNEPIGITVVTQWQQAMRVWLSFALGYGKLVKVGPVSEPKFLPLEIAYFLLHLLDPRGVGPLAVRNREQRRQDKV